MPLGIVAGRLVWRWLADNFPIVYVPPLALVAVLLVVPAAVLLANLLAALPGPVGGPHPPRRSAAHGVTPRADGIRFPA